VVCALLLLLSAPSESRDRGAAALDQALLDLSNDLRVVCLAAHPNDEDWGTLAWLRRGRGVATWVVLMTKGEGGESEIGGELDDDLAAIRERETRAAAEIVGAKVEFLGFPDFGYTESIEEAFDVWGREEVTRRLVGAVRRIRPHVVFTGRSSGSGQGQAAVAAILGIFEAAADPSKYPEEGEPWEIRKLLAGADAAKGAIVVPTGEVDRVRGISYAEMGLRSRRVHRSEAEPVRPDPVVKGPSYRLLKSRGDAEEGSFLGGLPVPRPEWRTGKNRSGTGEEILERVLALLAKPEDRRPARRRIECAAALAAGLELIVLSPEEPVVLERSVAVRILLRNGGAAPVTLVDPHAEVPSQSVREIATRTVTAQQAVTLIPVTVPVRVGRERVLLHLTGEARVLACPALSVRIAPWGRVFRPATDLNDPEQEITRFWVEIVNRDEVDHEEKLSMRIERTDRIRIAEPGPVMVPAGGSRWIRIGLRARDGLEEGLYPVVVSFGPAESRDVLRVLDVRIVGELNVGVVTTYGDDIVQFLRSIGLSPKLLSDQDLIETDLDYFSAIYLGIRPYRARPVLREVNARLLEYVKKGGHLVVNYNRPADWSPSFAPWRIRIGRGRVTEEDAPVVFEDPEHRFLTWPNKLEPRDFDGWVKERGIFFPDEWDRKNYKVILESADRGEPRLPGMLFAKYGEGTYVYTTFGWFRQLRNMNPGAMKMIANVISYAWR